MVVKGVVAPTCPECGSGSTHLIGKQWLGRHEASASSVDPEWDRFVCEDCWHRWEVEAGSEHPLSPGDFL
jgi:hypothetical protein